MCTETAVFYGHTDCFHTEQHGNRVEMCAKARAEGKACPNLTPIIRRSELLPGKCIKCQTRIIVENAK